MKKNVGISYKAFAVILAAVLILGGAIGGTMAWLIDGTEAVANVFTDTWIDIYGEDEAEFLLSYGVVATVLDDFQAQIRPTTKKMSKVFEGESITVTIIPYEEDELDNEEIREDETPNDPEVHSDDEEFTELTVENDDSNFGNNSNKNGAKELNEVKSTSDGEDKNEKKANESDTTITPSTDDADDSKSESNSDKTEIEETEEKTETNPKAEESTVSPEITPSKEEDETFLGTLLSMFTMTAYAENGVAPAEENDTTIYNVVINYIYENGKTAETSFTATVGETGHLNSTVVFPTILGYSPYVDDVPMDEYGFDLKGSEMTQDFVMNVVYKPTLVDYTVVVMQQNVHNDSYTEFERKTLQALTGTVITGDMQVDISYPGFYQLLHNQVTIAADGSTVIEVRFDRYYYLMTFELGEGGYGVLPVYARCGTEVEVDNPTRPGYVFTHWTNPQGETVKSPVTMPTNDIEITAHWTPSTAKYSVVYWKENADPNSDGTYGYTYWGSTIIDSVSGTVVSGSDDIPTSITNATVNGKTVDEKKYFTYNDSFKDYILDECFKRKILVQLEVLSASVHFDAYMLEVRNDEKEIEQIVNDGLKTGQISIPNAVKGSGFENIETVSQYLNKYGITIANRIRESFNPLFDPASEYICDRLKRINGNLKKNVGYTLYPAQLAVAEALKRRLDKAKVGVVVAECGSGKTKIGASALAAHQNGKKCFNVVLCPSHVTKKWVREIEETLPNTKAAVVYSLGDIDKVYKEHLAGNTSTYIILSKERARDGFMWQPAAVYSKVKKAYLCPRCGEIIEMEIKEDGTNYKVRADQFFFKKQTTQNHKCEHCGELLWSAINPNDKKLSHNKWVKIGNYGFIYRDFAVRHLEATKDLKVLAKLQEIIDNPSQVFTARGAYVRYSMSDYISERFKQIDGVILDELHQFKGDSGQGDAMETLVGCSKKVIGMTATLINGYSSGLFYLLYRIVPHLMQVDNKEYKAPQSFNNEYGVTEMTYELEEGAYNANSRSKKRLLQSRQKPGVSPLVYSRFLIDCAVFLSLNDMGKHLPDYEEIPIKLDLKPEIQKEYDRIKKKRRCLLV